MRFLSPIDAAQSTPVNLAPGVALTDAASVANLSSYALLAGAAFTGSVTVAGTLATPYVLVTAAGQANAISLIDSTLDATTANPAIGINFYKTTTSGSTRLIGYVGFNNADGAIRIGSTGAVTITGGSSAAVSVNSLLITKTTAGDSTLTSSYNIYLTASSSHSSAVVFNGSSGANITNGGLNFNWSYGSTGYIIANTGYLGCYSYDYTTGRHIFGSNTSSITAGTTSTAPTWNKAALALDYNGNGVFSGNVTAAGATFSTTLSVTGASTFTGAVTCTTALFSNAAVANTITITDTTLDATSTYTNAGFVIYKATTAGSTRQVGYFGGGGSANNGMYLSSNQNMLITSVQDGYSLTVKAGGNGAYLFLQSTYGTVKIQAGSQIQVLSTAQTQITSGTGSFANINGVNITTLGVVTMPGTLAVTGALSIGNTVTSGTITPTSYFTIVIGSTTYKIPIST